MITALQLKQAGFDDDSIVGFIEEQRPLLLKAGFSNHKINKAYGLQVNHAASTDTGILNGNDGDPLHNGIPVGKQSALTTQQEAVSGSATTDTDGSLLPTDEVTKEEAEANLITIDKINDDDRATILRTMQTLQGMIKEEGDVVGLQTDWLAKHYPNITHQEAKKMSSNELDLIEAAKTAAKSPLYRPWKTGVYVLNGKRYNKEEFQKRFPSVFAQDHEKIDTSKVEKLEVINTITTTGEHSRNVLTNMASQYNLKPTGIANINEALSFITELESGGRSIYNDEGNKTGLFQLSTDQTIEAANAFAEMNYFDNPDWEVPSWVTQLYVHRDMTRLMPDQQRALALARILKNAGSGNDILKRLADGDVSAIKDLYIDLHRNDQYTERETGDGGTMRERVENPELDARIEEITKYFDTPNYDYKNPEIAVYAADGWMASTLESVPVVGDKLVRWSGGKGHQNVFTNGYRMSMTGSISAFNSALLDGEDPATVYRRIFMTQEQSFGKQILQDFTMLMNDVPWYAAVGGACFAAGAATVGTAGVAGAALPVVCGGAAMSLPDGIRDAYSRALQNNEVDNLDDFFEQYFDIKTAKVMGKSAAVGSVTVGTGLAVRKVTESTIARLGAETVAMTTMASVLEGQVPTLKDFAHSAILIGGVHTTFKLAGKSKGVYDILHVLYNKYAIHPADVNKLAEMNPTFREQIINGEVPTLITDTAKNIQEQMHKKAGIEPILEPEFKINQPVETSVAGMEFGTVIGHKVIGDKTILEVRDASGNVKNVQESQVRPIAKDPIVVKVAENGKIEVTRPIEHPIAEAQRTKKASIDWEVYETRKRPEAKPDEAVTKTEKIADVVPLRIKSGGKDNAVSNGVVSVVGKYYPAIAKKLNSMTKNASNKLIAAASKTDVLIKANGGKPFKGTSVSIKIIGAIKAGGEFGAKTDQVVIKIGKDIINVSKDAYEAMRNYENEGGRQASPKIVGQGDTVLFINPKTNKIMATLKGEKTTGKAREQAEGFDRSSGAYYDRQNASRGDAPWQMPKERYHGEKRAVLPEGDNPFFQLFNAAKGVDMMDLVALVRGHLKNAPAMEGMPARNRGYFRSGGGRNPKIGINRALAKDPEGFIMTMAHEIGHMLDYIAKDGNTMKRGNILGSLASMKGYMNKWIDGKNDGAKSFSQKEINAFRKEAEIEAAKNEPKIDESINKIADETGAKITPQTILDIFQKTDARNFIPEEFYNAFAKLSNALKKQVVRDAAKGMLSGDLKRLADKINAKPAEGTKAEPLSSDATKRAEQIFAEKFQKALKERGLVDKEWVIAELKAMSQLWKPFERVEGSKYTQYRDSPRELMADFIMAWLLRPDWVKQHAPVTWETWAYHIAKKPKLIEQWAEIQNQLIAGNDARFSAGVKSILDMFDRGEAQKTKALEGEKATLRGRKNLQVEQTGYEIIDQFNWIYRRLQGKDTGTIRPRWHSEQAKELNITLENFRYRHANLKHYNDQITRKVVRKLEGMDLNYKHLALFMYLRNISESSQRDGVANPLGVMKLTPELKAILQENGQRSAQDMLTFFETKHPQLREIANEFSAIRQRLVIPVLKASKMFDAETMRKIEENPEYVTFSVVDNMVQRIEKFGETGVATTKVAKTKGTLGEIDNVFMATIEKDMRLLGEAKKNKTIIEMVAWIKTNKSWMETFNGLRDKAGNTIKEDVIVFPKYRGNNYGYDSPKAGMKALNYMENGKQKVVHLPENLVDAFFHNPLGNYMMIRILEASALPFKKMFTEYNPAFWGVNMFRDTIRSVRNLEGARMIDPLGKNIKTDLLKFDRSFLKYMFKAFSPAAKSIFGDGTQLTRFMEENGFLISMEDGYRGQSGAMARLRNMNQDDYAIERLLRKHNQQGNFVEQVYNKSFGMLFNALGNTARVAERVPKIAGAMYLRDQVAAGNLKMSVGEQMLRVQTEVGSPSFLRTGRVHALTNNILMYSNAANQGWRGDLVRLKEAPKSVIGKYIAYTVAPKMIQKAMELGAGGAGIAALYAGISEWDKTNYIAIPLGIMMPDGSFENVASMDEDDIKQGQVVYFRIPQDETARVINGMFHKGFDAILKEDPSKTGFQKYFDFASGQGYSLNPIFKFIPDILTSIGGDAPFDSFKNRSSIDRTTQLANDDRRVMEIQKWFWNSYGGQSIHKFKGRNEVEIAHELQELLEVPIVGRMIARFIKIGDNVAVPAMREAVKTMDVEDARTHLDFVDGMNIIINNSVAGETEKRELSEAHIIAIAKKQDVIKDSPILQTHLLQAGGASQQLQYFLEIDSEKKRIVALKAWLDTLNKFEKN